jgi:putative radical SAM enzyme (TIGR03279 family)
VSRNPEAGSHPGIVEAVSPQSLADRLGVRAGDELVRVNGETVRDVIDVRFYASDPEVRLRIRRAGRALDVGGERRYNEALGLRFEEPIFNRIRRCDNQCEFCFVAQMPKGLRPSLYVRDDDYRLSFLSGSYVTLTNLSEDDWKRIEKQHLSPLYVSVHATEPEVRRRFLGNPDAPEVMEQLRRLAAMDITVHTQVVVRPGLNDGAHLERSIDDLAGLHPDVCSVSVVPLGLTRYHRFDCRVPTDQEMEEVVERVEARQALLRERLGETFVFLSDEWYLRLGKAVPAAAHYDGLDLTENGVGLVRRFLDEGAGRLLRLVAEIDSPVVVTATLFAPTLRRVLEGTRARVVSVSNRFLGASITVAGLLTAEDVIERLKGKGGSGGVVLPPAMFGGPEGQSLDGAWPVDVEEALGRKVFARLPE